MALNIPGFLEGLVRGGTAQTIGQGQARQAEQQRQDALVQQQLMNELRTAEIANMQRLRDQFDANQAEREAEIAGQVQAFQRLFPDLAEIQDPQEVLAMGTIMRQDQIRAAQEAARQREITARRDDEDRVLLRQLQDDRRRWVSDQIEAMGVQPTPEIAQQLQAAALQLFPDPGAQVAPFNAEALQGAVGDARLSAAQQNPVVGTVVETMLQAVRSGDERVTRQIVGTDDYKNLRGEELNAVRTMLIRELAPMFEEGAPFADPSQRPGGTGFGIPFVGKDVNRFKDANTVEQFVDELLKG